MPNVVAVIEDDRARRQVEQFLNELGMEDLRYATFSSCTEFQALYFRDKKTQEVKPPEEKPKEGSPDQSSPEEGADLRLFSEVHLFIYSLGALGTERPSPWLDKLKVNMKKYKFWPKANKPRFIMLKYEDDGINKLDVLHPLLDDLIYLPLDRLVFLQKLQIFLALPKRATPSYLFNQEVKQSIEISKITKIDRLSDVGLAIRNPVPLKKGTPGHFYLQIPGEKDRLELWGKVLKSIPHPEHDGQFLVYFTYFHLFKSQLTAIRRWLSKSPRYQSFAEDDRSLFRYDPNALFDDSTLVQASGAVILDSDEIGGRNLTSAIKKEMDYINIGSESSLQGFLYKYFEPKSSNSEVPPQIAEAELFYKVPLNLTVAAGDLKLISIDHSPGEEDKFLNHKAADLFSQPDKWLSLLDSKESLSILQEAAQLAVKGRSLQKTFAVPGGDEIRYGLNLTLKKGSTDESIEVELAPATLADISSRLGSVPKETHLQLFIVDSDFVPEEPSGWIEGMRSRAQKAQLIENPQDLKFLVVTENETSINRNWLNSRDILGVVVKPVDLRGLLFQMSESLPNPYTLYCFKNLMWTEPNLSVHVAKSIELEALSEFGATLKSSQPLAPGTTLYLRKSIYDHAPNTCLAARVYACEEHSGEKGVYQVFATYFGINDVFLKYARTWIRENYAHQKGSGNEA